MWSEPHQIKTYTNSSFNPTCVCILKDNEYKITMPFMVNISQSIVLLV